MYVMGETPSIREILRYIASEWNHVSKPRVYLHDEGFFCFIKFQSIADKNEVLFSGPHMFNNKHIIVKSWTLTSIFMKKS